MNVANKNATDAAAKGDAPTIIIKKIKKRGHEAHHGGAWKVAYADFVTAMMAFFLLLWLLNATTEEQRRGISNYFAPESVSRNSSGSGGVLGGTQASREDQAVSPPNTPGVLVPIPQASGGQTDTVEESTSAPEGEADSFANSDETSEVVRPRDQADSVGQSGGEGYQDGRDGQEETFAKVERAVLKALDESPKLHKLADNLLIDRTDEGLRIQMIDQDKVAMFPLGSSEMNAHTRELLKRMAVILSRLPNKIAVTGHTDSTPYSGTKGYGNWELSSDRANASRRALMQAGIPANRFARVVGKADQEPLLPKDPTNSRNRRISIVVLRINESPE